MSQSATLYRISKDYFFELEHSENIRNFNIFTISKDYTSFQSSFLGLEYILSKGIDFEATELVSKIFNPNQAIGRKDFENLTSEQKSLLYENGGLISYLDTKTISKLAVFLETISEELIHLKYDAKELNDNNIYPTVWHNDNAENLSYNERDILEGFRKLKKIIIQAKEEQDYILVFVG